MTAVLNSLLDYSSPWLLVSGEWSYSFCDTMLCWFFLVLYELFFGWCIRRSKFFASLGKTFFTWFCQASVISLVLSCLNKNLKRRTLKPLACHSSWTDCVIALRQISVTAPCYSSVLFRKQQENTSSRHEGMPTQRCKENQEPRPFGSSFCTFFILLPCCPGPALCKLG